MRARTAKTKVRYRPVLDLPKLPHDQLLRAAHLLYEAKLNGLESETLGPP
jgi:hypothetical protein